LNDINGGSFAVTAARRGARGVASNRAVVEWMLANEARAGLDTPAPYRDFARRVAEHRGSLRDLVGRLRADGKKVFGYGASTKGNVVLQYCGFTAEDIACIADVNPDKFGCVTPGTNIPIVSEADARAEDPDFFLVLPWHFRATILEREREFTARGGHFIFPFPEIEVV